MLAFKSKPNPYRETQLNSTLAVVVPAAGVLGQWLLLFRLFLIAVGVVAVVVPAAGVGDVVQNGLGTVQIHGCEVTPWQKAKSGGAGVFTVGPGVPEPLGTCVAKGNAGVFRGECSRTTTEDNYDIPRGADNTHDSPAA